MGRRNSSLDSTTWISRFSQLITLASQSMEQSDSFMGCWEESREKAKTTVKRKDRHHAQLFTSLKLRHSKKKKKKKIQVSPWTGLAGFMKHLQMQVTVKSTDRLKNFGAFCFVFQKTSLILLVLKIRFVFKTCLNNLSFYLGQHKQIRAQILIYSIGRAIIYLILPLFSAEFCFEK